MDIIASFLQAEINTQDLYDDIINYITSYHIREGEFEGNRREIHSACLFIGMIYFV